MPSQDGDLSNGMRPYRYIPVISPTYRSLRRVFSAARYSGTAVSCPVCERSFKSWLGRHEHGLCPYCRSSCRHRLLSMHLAETCANEEKPLDTLFFAPDWGMEKWLRRRRQFRCATTDLGAPGVDFHSDITQLPSADESYDLILCSHVLEHIPDDSKAIAEIYRVLRPGGRAMIQIPWNSASESTDEDPSVTDIRERERRFGQFDHVRMYGRDVIDRLGRPGFQVEVLNLVRCLDVSEARRLGLWDDEIFVCKKPR